MKQYSHKALWALGIAGTLFFGACGNVWSTINDEALIIGTSVPMTGPLGEFGLEVSNGVKAAFETINAKGGIHGRHLKFIAKDDAYNPQKTTENVKGLIDDDKVLALLGVGGTANNLAVAALIDKAYIASIAPVTGATAVRSAEMKTVFHLRASYADEAEKIVDYLTSLGIKNIGVVYQNNAFGKDVLSGIERAMKRSSITPAVSATVENDASDAAKAATKIADVSPEAVILGTAGKPSVAFVREFRKLRTGVLLFGTSIMGTQTSVKALGPDGIGLAVSQVVPYPWTMTTPIIKEYQQAMTKIGVKDYSFLSLEYYMNARVLAEALKRAGPAPTRAKVIASLAAMKNVDLGGLHVNFSQPPYVSPQYVELTIINKTGRFVR